MEKYRNVAKSTKTIGNNSDARYFHLFSSIKSNKKAMNNNETTTKTCECSIQKKTTQKKRKPLTCPNPKFFYFCEIYKTKVNAILLPS
jgi:hypothetical protein